MERNFNINTLDGMRFIADNTFDLNVILDMVWRISRNLKEEFDYTKAPAPVLNGGESAQQWYEGIFIQVYSLFDYIYKAKINYELVVGEHSEQTKAYIKDIQERLALYNIAAHTGEKTK